MAAGSLGQELSAANGIVYANKRDGIERRVFCLLRDGECSEGVVCGAAHFTAEKALNEEQFSLLIK